MFEMHCPMYMTVSEILYFYDRPICVLLRGADTLIIAQLVSEVPVDDYILETWIGVHVSEDTAKNGTNNQIDWRDVWASRRIGNPLICHTKNIVDEGEPMVFEEILPDVLEGILAEPGVKFRFEA